jgi:alpha-glucosidase
VIYQVYLRSFADSDGDGLGDINGIRSRLGYLAELGVDAIWVNPWYPSPMADAGYDVSDPRAVEPRFGDLADAEALVREAHDAGLRVLLDLVPNHTSDQHRWFQEALAAGPGSAARERYLFRPGKGPSGDEPPNDWRSEFGGPAWTRVTEADGRPGEWYLHLFAPEQPDVNWANPDIPADVAETMRFWFDRGVDGFRIDVAHALVKAPGLPDIGTVGDPRAMGPDRPRGVPDHPHYDREGVHEIYRAWRQLADRYDPPRVFVAEAWVGGPERLARYVRPDELHTAFNFEFLLARWLAPELRRVIDETLEAHAGVGAPPTWVLSNHDGVRHLSRYARPQTPGRPMRHLKDLRGTTPDLALGTRRARAAVLLLLALPGGAYLYQGEELGLPEVEDLAPEVLQDPIWERSGHTNPGRDGSRVPIPWSGDRPPYGFSPDGVATWLPQPDGWAGLTVAAETGREGSMLELYREALRLRRRLPALGDGTLRWLASPDDALVFAREPGFVCAVNLGAAALPLPAGAEVVLASAPPGPGGLATDAAAWLRLGGA